MKRQIKSLINKLGYDLYNLPPNLIENYFNKKNTEKVLISYITRPFTDSPYFSHTNRVESLEIASIFDELGFNVDIIDYYNKFEKIDYTQYTLIFGLGQPLENSFSVFNCKAKRVYYATGCHPYFQNNESLKRVRVFFEEHNIWLTSSARVVDNINPKSLVLSDAIFALGNQFVAKTYENAFQGTIKSINASSILTYPIDLNSKQFDKARHHFLWFGSIGLLHKGLDLVLKVFRERSDIYLHICAPLSKEAAFERFFYKELYETANIKSYGFIDIRSQIFEKLLYKCAFCIFPSASEGGCASIVNLMRNSGMIPLVTANCGLDIEPFGFIINELSTNSINNIISEVLQLTNNELFERTQQCLEFAQKYHSLDSFRATIKAHFCEILHLN